MQMVWLKNNIRLIGAQLFLIFFIGLCFANVVNSSTPNSSDTLTNKERQEIIKNIIVNLHDNYLYPDIAKKMILFLEKKLSNHAYDSTTTLENFSKVLGDDLTAICQDKHLALIYSPTLLPSNAMLNAAINTEDLTKQEKLKLSSEMGHYNYAFEEVKVLPGNVGYLRLHIFWPVEFSIKTADAAMSFLANSGALIIDLRENYGGQPAMVAYLLSYLFDNPVHLNDIYNPNTHQTKQWWTSTVVPGLRYAEEKPVYVLTSHNTFSGAEEFAYDLQSLKRATIIGEQTKGGAHPVRLFKINPHLAIAIPYAESINPITGTNWEDKGVIPDINVSAKQAFDTAYKKGLQYNLQHTNDQQLKGIIQATLNKKGA